MRNFIVNIEDLRKKYAGEITEKDGEYKGIDIVHTITQNECFTFAIWIYLIRKKTII